MEGESRIAKSIRISYLRYHSKENLSSMCDILNTEPTKISTQLRSIAE